jgi:FkbH-like protein
LLAPDDFDAQVGAMRGAEMCDAQSANAVWQSLQALANRRLDFMQTRKLDRLVREKAERASPPFPRLKLALIGSSTLDHLAPAIRIGALRRGLFVDLLIGDYGQWRQVILDPASALYAFEPDAVLLSHEVSALVSPPPLSMSEAEMDAMIEGAVHELRALWKTLRERAQAIVIQQTPWQLEANLFGHIERLVSASPSAIAHRLDSAIAEAAQNDGTLLLDLNGAVAQIGARQISDITLWHHGKQAVSPAAAPWYGDQVGRILAALRGLSKKVLVLDLDNTLWGGVVGDDGLDGIAVGQGSATGEAYAGFQGYIKRLAERGVVLAVSSKNDRAVAERPFRDHPDMLLRLDDFAAFEADWNDKPSALQRIAQDLELGLDSFVFVDDNPAERALMRQTLPQVAVPELPAAPELYARCLSDAGYFEAVAFTSEDTKRNQQYAANRERKSLQTQATDMDSFLRDLRMVLTVSPFRSIDIARITQLINKTNQFNLTTRRYTEAEVEALMGNPDVLTVTGRLSDKFGDNGLTSILIGRPSAKNGAKGGAPAIEIDTWLMSCRVLGRHVEEAILATIAEDARARGARELIGRYVPTPKNAMVRNHYEKLGFLRLDDGAAGGDELWRLSLEQGAVPAPDYIELVRDNKQ